MSDSEAAFSSLPLRIQQKIDRVFDTVSRATFQPTGPFEDTQLPVGGGGFIIDDELSISGGGFLNDTQMPSSIPYSSLPGALQMLDLPPDDEHVMAVFRNASEDDPRRRGEGGLICRDVWRSVCAVLLEGDSDMVDEDEPMDVYSDVGPPNISYDDSDEYRENTMADSGRGSDGFESDDEYVEGSAKKTSARRTTRTTRAKLVRSSRSESSASSIKKPTARQDKIVLETFALFFPSLLSGSPELPTQRLKLRDLQNVANLLGENLKAQEMLEMLETFSTSPDKTMGLSDFEAMMIAANLV